MLKGFFFNITELRVYQVSETHRDSLIVEGWFYNSKRYEKIFFNISTWKSLYLDFRGIDQLKIYSGNQEKALYNFDYNFGDIVVGLVPIPKKIVVLNPLKGG